MSLTFNLVNNKIYAIIQPPTPIITSVVPSLPNILIVSWNNLSKLSNFLTYNLICSDNTLNVYGITTNSYSVVVTPAISYTFKVVTVINTDIIPVSSNPSVPYPITLLSVPVVSGTLQKLLYNDVTGSVTLTWNGINGAKSYNIIPSLSSIYNIPGIVFNNITKETSGVTYNIGPPDSYSYTISNIPVGSISTFQIAAVANDGTISYSNQTNSISIIYITISSPLLVLWLDSSDPDTTKSNKNDKTNQLADGTSITSTWKDKSSYGNHASYVDNVSRSYSTIPITYLKDKGFYFSYNNNQTFRYFKNYSITSSTSAVTPVTGKKISIFIVCYINTTSDTTDLTFSRTGRIISLHNTTSFGANDTNTSSIAVGVYYPGTTINSNNYSYSSCIYRSDVYIPNNYPPLINTDNSINSPRLLVHEFFCDGINFSNRVIYNTQYNINGGSMTDNFNISGFNIGTNNYVPTNGYSYVFNGYIAEILFYNTNLGTINSSSYNVTSNTDSNSPTNIELIEGYLSWKWGIQSELPSTHPYKTTSVSL